ncbi:MAG: hypothetical protein IJQ82_10395 [Selenomonadaceae bacterium]|nr:hypothetical protein [Selenomonadaceae bacterium]
MTDEYLTYKYDRSSDVMHVFFNQRYKEANYGYYVADDVTDDIKEMRDVRNEDLVGFVILDYRRNKPELVKRYPEYFF